MTQHPIVLASASPRRKQLLQQAEIIFEIKTCDTDESFPADMPLVEVPIFIANNKAKAVKNICSFDSIIIAADTVVICDDIIIGKPISAQNAIEILSTLSGKTHHVITGVSIIHGSNTIAFSDTTQVTFNTISQADIEHYVTHYKPYDKAGAYAIQEWIGVVGIKKIEGCFYNVMGLPVSKVLEAIKKISNESR
jgi:septum formation protein